MRFGHRGLSVTSRSTYNAPGTGPGFGRMAGQLCEALIAEAFEKRVALFAIELAGRANGRPGSRQFSDRKVMAQCSDR